MVYIPEKIKMNKIFKILIFILAIEILLGYAFYFKDSSLISGHYVSSSWSNSYTSILMNIKRGDYIQLGGVHSEHKGYSRFQCFRVK